MSLELRRHSLKIVELLIIVEAVSVYFLWTLNGVSEDGNTIFAILLAVVLVAFAMISYLYRTYKSGDNPSRGLLIGACCMILLLIYASLAV